MDFKRRQRWCLKDVAITVIVINKRCGMRKIKGFTLVELLVVISIIAMLLAILVPAMGKARELSRRIVCSNNLKTMAMGDILYAQTCDNWHVPIYDGAVPDNWMWFQNPLFIRLIAMKGRVNTDEKHGYKALTLPKEYKCPTDKRTVANGGLLVEVTDITGTSYGMNSIGLRAYPPGVSGGDWPVYNRSGGKGSAQALKTTQVERPVDKFFFMDSEWAYVNYASADYLQFWDQIGDRRSSKEWDMPAYRHKEGANMVFYDGHMKYLSKKEIFQYDEDGDVQFWRLNMPKWMPIHPRMYLYPPYN